MSSLFSWFRTSTPTLDVPTTPPLVYPTTTPAAPVAPFMAAPLVAARTRPDDAIRPARLEDYIGQETHKAVLRDAILAAQQRGESLRHVLLYGPPGTGKTSLANVLATELGVRLHVVTGPMLTQPVKLIQLLVGLAPHDCLFIDEIHAVDTKILELLYPALEDGQIDVPQPGTKITVRRRLSPFTLIGATTKAAGVPAPLRDRFGLVVRLDPYTNREVATLLLRASDRLGIVLPADGAAEIARRSRQTPRIGLRNLFSCRDYAQIHADGQLTGQIAAAALDRLRIDKLGLDDQDRKLLRTILFQFDGGPVGLSTLASAMNEDAGTIQEVQEPYLVQLGFIQPTKRGRIVTQTCRDYFGFV